MNRSAACLCLAFVAVACTSTRTPTGYCEDDCREVWTEECLAQCGIERPGGCDREVCPVGGTSGAGAGGAGTGGSGGAGAGGSGGRDGGTGAGGSGGVVSGTGGSGGTDGGQIEPDAQVTCDVSRDCDAQAPLCNAQSECERCVNNAPCSGRPDTPRCDISVGSPTEGQCVRCTEDADCDDGQVCDGTECVECDDDADCADPAEPQCNEGACEPCTSDAACEDRSSTHCDTDEGSDTLGQCVECLEHADCENPEPQCRENRTCGGCTGNDACEDRGETPYCNTLDGASREGQCVACTGATEEAACAAKACKRDTGTCTERDRRSVQSCGPCEADSECDTNSRCVENQIGSVVEGTFCALLEGSGCARAADASRKPYSEPRELTSVDGHDDTFCMPVTTCAMLDGDLDGSVGKACDTNVDCGSSAFANDGICVGAGVCTYACSQHYQCPSTGLTQCSLIGGPGGYCE